MANDPIIGRQLANFRIERLLGHGGMAQVYFGHDVNLQRPVAIKVIDARFRGSASYAERFVREARIIALWRHENILQIYYAGEEDNLYYYVMEYINGPDLAQLIAEYTRAGELMPYEDVLRIGHAVARALDYAHAQGIIHRDVKPSNVMVASDGRVVLTDFGLALDVAQGTVGEVFGTPHYIAPEQARRSSDAIPQSDIYALGVVLYEVLTGSVPFDDPSPTSLALQHLTMPPPPPRQINPALSEETEAVLLKALSKNPTDRYPMASALMDALDTALHAAQDRPNLAALPPIPAEVQVPPLSLSGVTVASQVAQYVTATYTPAGYPEPLVAHTRRAPTPVAVPAQQATSRQSWRGRGLIAGAATLGVIALAALLFLVLGDGKGSGKSSEITLSPIDESALAAVPTMPSTSAVPTNTPIPTATQTAIEVLPAPALTSTLPPTGIPTNTLLPSEPPLPTLTVGLSSTPLSTTTPLPTATDLPTAAPTLPPPTAAPTAEPPVPTVLYPNGRHFVLYYDANTLYVRNFSGTQSEVRPFAFERLDSAGNSRNHVDGSRWVQFYAVIYPSACIRIIILDRPAYLPSPSCQAINSEVWAERGKSLDFWTPQEGSTQFRVLWNGQEIGRCEISAGTCEVYAP